VQCPHFHEIRTRCSESRVSVPFYTESLFRLFDREQELYGLTKKHEPTFAYNYGLTQVDNLSDTTQDVGPAPGSYSHNTKPHVQETDIEKAQHIYEELGMKLPDWLIEVLAKEFDGMMPMDRFLAETCEAEAALQGTQSETRASSREATYALSMEGGNVGDGTEADQKTG
jgi:hypothetical protein